MQEIHKSTVAVGIHWIEIPAAGLRVLCGCPADAVKHLAKRGLIIPTEINGVACETGPNAVLLSDHALQNGEFANLAEFPVLQMLYKQGSIAAGSLMTPELLAWQVICPTANTCLGTAAISAP